MLSSDRRRVPDEVWGEIFAALNLRDRVTASHVCRAWRAAALHNPRLWTDIRIRAVNHHDACTCDRCAIFRTCSTRVQILLERSAKARLACRINMPADVNPATPPESPLLCMISPHASRVSELFISTKDSSQLRTVLRLLGPLPRLETLAIYGERVRPHPDRAEATTLHLDLMPAIVRLSLSTCVKWDAQLVMSPTLQSLDAWFSSSSQLLNALRSCPGLDRLHARLAFWSLGPHAVRDDITAATVRLRELYLTNVSPYWNAGMLAMFTHAHTPSVTLEYPCPGMARHYDVPAVLPGVCIMRHLQGAVSIALSGEYKRLKIVARDAAQRVRTVVWAMEWTSAPAMQALWSALASASVTSLTVDWPLAAVLLGTAGSFPAVQSLALRLPAYYAVPFMPYAAPALEELAVAPLPSLSRVTLYSDTLARFFQLPYVLQFLESVCPARRLDRFELQNVLLEEHDPRLGAVARRVVQRLA